MNRTMQRPQPPRHPLWRLPVWGGAAVLWMTPWVAMQFTDEVRWTGMDFAVFAIMLLVACGGCELAMRVSRHPFYRAGAAVAIGTGFMMVWSNLAVGLLGSERDPINLVFFGVLAFGAIGALVTRLRAGGLARTLSAMAALQGLIAIVAIAGFHAAPVEAIAVTVAFAGLWLLAAWLFRRALPR